VCGVCVWADDMCVCGVCVCVCGVCVFEGQVISCIRARKARLVVTLTHTQSQTFTFLLRDTYMNELYLFFCIFESSHIYSQSLTDICHAHTHMTTHTHKHTHRYTRTHTQYITPYESCHTRVWVMSHMSHVTRGLHHIWITSHMCHAKYCMSHVTHVNAHFHKWEYHPQKLYRRKLTYDWHVNAWDIHQIFIKFSSKFHFSHVNALSHVWVSHYAYVCDYVYIDIWVIMYLYIQIMIWLICIYTLMMYVYIYDVTRFICIYTSCIYI